MWEWSKRVESWESEGLVAMFPGDDVCTVGAVEHAILEHMKHKNGMKIFETYGLKLADRHLSCTNRV